MDRRLKEVNTFIRADSRISASPVMKLVFGDPRLFLSSLPTNSLIHCSAVWSCREKVSLLSLAHIVEQNDGKDTVPVLWRFLHRVRKQHPNSLLVHNYSFNISIMVQLYSFQGQYSRVSVIYFFFHRKQRSNWWSTFLTSSHSRGIWLRSFRTLLSWLTTPLLSFFTVRKQVLTLHTPLDLSLFNWMTPTQGMQSSTKLITAHSEISQ